MSNAGHFKSKYDERRNLGGRPKGSKDIRSAITLKMIRDHTPRVEKALMDAALKAEAGVEEWQKWYLDRMLPILYGKPRAEIELIDTTNLEEVVEHLKGNYSKSTIEEAKREAMRVLTEGNTEEIASEEG